MTTDGADVASLIEACVAEVSFDAISENTSPCCIHLQRKCDFPFFFFLFPLPGYVVKNTLLNFLPLCDVPDNDSEFLRVKEVLRGQVCRWWSGLEVPGFHQLAGG